MLVLPILLLAAVVANFGAEKDKTYIYIYICTLH